MPDHELLERVRELRARGRSPKEIARALKVRPATVTPLIRRLATAEPQEKEAPLIGCWVNQGWSSSVRFTGHPEWPDPDEVHETRGRECARSATASVH
jgi:orotate phosphoribosyltransferase-like protein